MKRIFSIFATCVAMVIAASALTSCKETQGIVWNIEAQAAGEGKITVEYPTGNPGLVVEGNAVATATTTNDTTVVKAFNDVFEVCETNGDNSYNLKVEGLFANEVVENPDNYSKQEVKDAEALMNEVENAVKFHAEGDWKASVTGYAKYGQMYFVIDEHWPADSTKVAIAE